MAKAVITKQDNDKIAVGGKPVRRDMEGNWVAQLPLTEYEKRDMYRFLENNDML